jgi:hypothetical protein
MRAFAVLLIVMVAACDVPRAGDLSSPTPDVLMGQYKAASDSARQLTGDVSIERGGLVFAKGVVLYTRVLDPRRGGDLIARDGDTYAAAALGPSDLAIELRRVTEQTVQDGARGLCGEERPQYVALAYGRARAAEVTLLAFAGEEPPGPSATRSRVCAAFAYAAPDGARTRQGVVLR